MILVTSSGLFNARKTLPNQVNTEKERERENGEKCATNACTCGRFISISILRKFTICIRIPIKSHKEFTQMHTLNKYPNSPNANLTYENADETIQYNILLLPLPERL